MLGIKVLMLLISEVSKFYHINFVFFLRIVLINLQRQYVCGRVKVVTGGVTRTCLSFPL